LCTKKYVLPFRRTKATTVSLSGRAEQQCVVYGLSTTPSMVRLQKLQKSCIESVNTHEERQRGRETKGFRATSLGSLTNPDRYYYDVESIANVAWTVARKNVLGTRLPAREENPARARHNVWRSRPSAQAPRRRASRGLRFGGYAPRPGHSLAPRRGCGRADSCPRTLRRSAAQIACDRRSLDQC